MRATSHGTNRSATRPRLLLMDKVIHEVANEYMPTAWNALPKDVKDDIILMTDQESNVFLADFMRDMQKHVDDVIDIKDMTVSACVANKPLVNKIFQECGEKEFVFIRQSWILVWDPANGGMVLLRCVVDTTSGGLFGGMDYQLFGAESHFCSVGTQANLVLGAAGHLLETTKRSVGDVCENCVWRFCTLRPFGMPSLPAS